MVRVSEGAGMPHSKFGQQSASQRDRSLDKLIMYRAMVESARSTAVRRFALANIQLLQADLGLT